MKWMAAAGLLASLGCATSGVPMADAETQGFSHGVVSGIVKLPDGADGAQARALCSNLAVTASSPQGQVGLTQVRTSKGRCFFEISRLPADVDLAVTVKPGAGWTCGNGQQMVVAQPSQTVRLKAYENRTEDFRTSCSAQST